MGLHPEGFCRYQPVLSGLRVRVQVRFLLGCWPNRLATVRALGSLSPRGQISRSGDILPIYGFLHRILFRLRLYLVLPCIHLLALGPFGVSERGYIVGVAETTVVVSDS